MTDLLRVGLPIYFILYFIITFVVKSFLVAKKIGKNPFVIPNNDSTYGLVGYYFKITLTSLFLYTLSFAFFPFSHKYFLTIIWLQYPLIQYIGITLLLMAFVVTVIAQSHLKNSWRIGIDHEVKTELITSGVFSVSRNPIFLGMITALVGLFLVTPNALSLLFLILGYVLIQIQIRLEEEFLTQTHGEKYLAYKQKTARLI